MSKKTDSNNKVLYLLIAAIGISLIGTLMLYNQTSITGHATATGKANLTIVTRTEINFTVDNVNFGTGYVAPACNNCTMDSEGNTDACCVDFHGETDGFTIENIGNTNVTLNVSFAKDADTLLGGTAAINAYQFKVSNGANPGCTGSLSNTVYTEITAASQYLACDDMNFQLGTNEVDVDIKVVVPENSKKGELSDIITATAEEV